MKLPATMTAQDKVLTAAAAVFAAGSDRASDITQREAELGERLIAICKEYSTKEVSTALLINLCILGDRMMTEPIDL